MNDFRIRADSFLLKSRHIRIYRVRLRSSGTVYWTKPDDMLRYLRELRIEILPNKGASHER